MTSKEQKDKILNLMIALSNLMSILDELIENKSDKVSCRSRQVKRIISYSFENLTDKDNLRLLILEDILHGT